MKKSLLLCTILVCVVSATASFADSAGSVSEDFDTGDYENKLYIDDGSSGETPQRMTAGTGFSWGGMAIGGDGEIWAHKGSYMLIKNTDPNSYYYTIFDSTGGNSPDTTINLTAGRIKSEMSIKEDDLDGFTFRYMVRNGEGNWYISDSNFTAVSSAKTWFELETAYGEDTWTQITNTVSLDALAGGDEVALTLGSSGLNPYLDSVDGMGIYVESEVGGIGTKLLCYQMQITSTATPDAAGWYDLGLFTKRWLNEGTLGNNWCDGADINRSGRVNFVDFALFGQFWLNSRPGYVVSSYGDDSNPGTLMQPFRTIQKAADSVVAGSTVYIREGRYHETVTMDNVDGTENNPITFTSFPGEEVVLDGTVPLSDIATGGWVQHDANIYKITVDTNMTQLFVDDKMMTNARWPNIDSNDEDAHWYRHRWWGYQDSSNASLGNLYDLPHHDVDLAATNTSFEGAMAVMNIGVFRTYCTEILSHTAGSDHFTYDGNIVGYEPEDFANKNKHDKSRYYIECHLNCLDAEKEWFFDMDTKTLYLWAPGGGNPTGKDIRCKTLGFAFDFYMCNATHLKNLNFFCSCFRMGAKGADGPKHSLVEDCNFQYPTFNERMLKHKSGPESGFTKQPPHCYIELKENGANNVVRNCRFEHFDGMGLRFASYDSEIDNLLFRDADWTNTGNRILMCHNCTNLDAARITMDNVGSPDPANSEWYTGISWKYVRASRIGRMAYDGCPVESWCDEGGYSWSHDHPKLAYRFDGSHLYSLSHHNVSWMTSYSKYKGDWHELYNLTGCNGMGSEIAVYRGDCNDNANTITRNCAAEDITSGNSDCPALPGTHTNNYEGDLSTQLRDWKNLDFRPKSGSDLIDAGYEIAGITDGYNGTAPDIGAYEYGDPNYWIPGFQFPEASTPVPPDDATRVKTDADLMWLQGYKATSHDVYFGTDEAAVSNATTGDSQFKGSKTTNIYDVGTMDANTVYYWRIDANGGPDGIIKGETWSFVTEGTETGHSFTVIEDSYVDRGSPSANHGSDTTLMTRLYGSDGFGKTSHIIFLKFNVTGLTDRIAGATLRVKAANTGDQAGLHVRGARDFDSWDESTVTWINDRPICEISAVDAVESMSANTWYDLDVSRLVKGNGAYTLALTIGGGSDQYIYSKESSGGANAPQLIVYTMP